VLYSCLKKT